MKIFYILFFLLFSLLRVNAMDSQDNSAMPSPPSSSSPSPTRSPLRKSASCTHSPKVPKDPRLRVFSQEKAMQKQDNRSLGASKSLSHLPRAKSYPILPREIK